MPEVEPVNMVDIANQVGVSVSTVSRALSGASGVSKARREEIRNVAQEMAYVISPEASSLSRGSSTTRRVAIVLPHLDSWFYSTILAGIADVLGPAELDMVVYQVGTSLERNQFFSTMPARRKVDAVIVVAMPLQEYEREQLDSMGLPIVCAGGNDDHYVHVDIDDHLVALQAVNYLIRIGHTRIGMINTVDSEGLSWAADTSRAEGYRQALESAGLEWDSSLEVQTSWGNDSGTRVAELLLSGLRPPTAVFAFSDEIAVAAMRTFRQAGMLVPQDISVVGVDDHPFADVCGLTTIHQPVRRQGTTAARLLVELLAGEVEVAQRTVLPTRLVIRNSAAAPNENA